MKSREFLTGTSLGEPLRVAVSNLAQSTQPPTAAAADVATLFVAHGFREYPGQQPRVQAQVDVF